MFKKINYLIVVNLELVVIVVVIIVISRIVHSRKDHVQLLFLLLFGLVFSAVSANEVINY